MLVLAQETFGSGGGGAAAPAAGPAAPAGGATPSAGGGYEQILFIVLMFVVFYFLLIRPQQKQRKKHQELVKNLKRGDTVITNSGMFGQIVAMDDTSVTLEIAKNTRVKMLKSYVGGLANAETEKQLAENPPAT
ncbi:MAG: preprotein translocase subunit YajC [Deltaproteobacteria bacterium]|nr:preprotein translocase subunit YajC [Deltaproteobacteria bacterium]MCB9785163.1 preprotein translocase subunit YajC [Deltaproteobacteria bacterium]